MEKKLQSILAMYDDADSTSDGVSASALENDRYRPPQLNDDTKPSVEDRRLAEAKYVLDRRQSVRPDVSVIDAIVRESKTAYSVDRPKRGLRLISGLMTTSAYPMRYAVAASVVLIAVALGVTRLGGITDAIFQPDDVAATSDADVAERDQRPSQSSPAFQAKSTQELADQELGRRSLEQASPLSQTSVASLQSAGIAHSDSIPAWDDEARVRMLQRRIDALTRGNADLGWDQQAVPLEQLTRVPVQPGVVRAGANQ